MKISTEEISLEKERLKHTTEVIAGKLSNLGQELYTREEKQQEFQKFVWDNKASLDPQELRSLMSGNDVEIYMMLEKGKYFQKLFKIQNNPYFGSIIFKEEDGNLNNIYIGITHLEDDDKYLIHDWRSPICSLFYDFESGECFYKAPEGIIKGYLERKRQYKIVDKQLIHVFDNSINIDDDLLQEVLANDSSEKMRNIVNTIQQEQNLIIRNTEDQNLVVQGIAGSGKTSVALHRIAFLLYKIKNLTSKNILIFSPNNVFTEYISNVLPELGEDNTNESTFHDFLSSSITEYKNIESFTSFISRYYTYKEKNPELVKYKQSNEIITDIDNYVKEYVKNTKFIKNIEEVDSVYSKTELNYLLHNRYSKFPLFQRIKEMSIKISEINYNGKHTRVKTIHKHLIDSLNIKRDYKKIYYDFFTSSYCKINLSEQEIKSFVNKKDINYEDSILFVYIKSLLEGFEYNNLIQEIVIDEAQDYTKLQYILLAKIFKKSGFTILGDVNQTINPYYKYDSLKEVCDLLNGSTKYLELSKTYRSSEEIIEYTNKILGLSHVTAIRKSENKPILFRNINNLKEQLINDIESLKNNYNSIAIITKDDFETNELYSLLEKDLEIGIITADQEIYKRDLIIISAYMAKGLEFDSVMIYDKDKNYKENEKNLYYVACTRAQHELIIYN